MQVLGERNRKLIASKAPCSWRQSPDDPWSASSPIEVPSSAVVDVRHRGGFRASGSIRGTVAGSRVDLVLQLPWPAGSVVGTLGDQLVTVSWNLETSESPLPDTLHGWVGAQAANIQGVFRSRINNLGKSYFGGWLEGTLTGASLKATVGPADGRPNSHTMVATGTLGAQDFNVLADPRRGVRGTYDGQTVHLDHAATASDDSVVIGACPAPPAFTALLIAVFLFFAQPQAWMRFRKR
jgi:hypothetical protein